MANNRGFQRTPVVLFIRAEWDPEAGVWVAASDHVPGLATEAVTLEALSTKLETMVPELLDANGYPDSSEVPFELLARKFSVGLQPLPNGRVLCDRTIAVIACDQLPF